MVARADLRAAGDEGGGLKMKTWRVELLRGGYILPTVVTADSDRAALRLVLEHLNRRGEYQATALTPPADDEGGTR